MSQMNTPTKGNQEEEDLNRGYNTSRGHRAATMAFHTEQKEQMMNPLNRSMDDIDLDDHQEDQIDSRQRNNQRPDQLDEYGEEYDDEIDSQFFYNQYPASPRKGNRASYISSGSSSFRESTITDETQLQTMRIQSLTSIVGQPRKDSIQKKIYKMVKQKLGRNKNITKAYKQKFSFKATNEKEISDSFNIPTVHYSDFDSHIRKTKHNACIFLDCKQEEQIRQSKLSAYKNQDFNNTMSNPFEIATGRESGGGDTSRSMELHNNQFSNLSNRNLSVENTVVVPQNLFEESYQVGPQILKPMLTGNQDLTQLLAPLENELGKFEKYLEIVDTDLEQSIRKNKDFFNRAFNHIENIKHESRDASLRSKRIQQATKNLKIYQLVNMVQVYRFQRKKLNIAKASEMLKYLTVLQQSIPVIDNLIKNSDNINSFETGLDLIKNALELITTKLNGVEVTKKFKERLNGLRAQTIKRIENKSIDVVKSYLNGWIQRRTTQEIMIKQQPFTLMLIKDILYLKKPEEGEQSQIIQQQQSVLQSIFAANEQLEDKYPQLISNILDSWVFCEQNETSSNQEFNDQIDQFQKCIFSILKSEDQSIIGGQSANIMSQQINKSLDNLLIQIKNAHTSTLKENNHEAILQFMMDKFVKIISVDECQRRLKDLTQQLLIKDDEQGQLRLVNENSYKKVFKYLSQAISQLSRPVYSPPWPMSTQRIKQEFETCFQFKSEIQQVLISGFLLQAMVAVQMGRALQGVEDLVIGALIAWQKTQKESQFYLLMSTKDQKSILLNHERQQKYIRQVFTESKENLKTNIQKKMEKWFKDFNNEAIEAESTNQTDGGLMHFFMSPIKRDPSKDIVEEEKDIDKELLKTFFEMNNLLVAICRYLTNDTSLNPHKIPMISIESQFDMLQKEYIVNYKTFQWNSLKHFFDEKEKFVQSKDIKREDQEEILSKILICHEDNKSNESIEFEDDSKIHSQQIEAGQAPEARSYPSNILIVERLENNKLVYSQQYKLFACQLQFNRVIYEFIDIIKYKMSSKQVKMYDGSAKIIEFIKVYNNHVKSQVLGCGAYYQRKVDSITAKHLAIAQNCIRLVLKEILPSLRVGVFITSDKSPNTRKMLTNQTDEIEKELQDHITEIYQKLSSMMVEFTKQPIQSALNEVEWDKTISKGTLIEPSKHIVQINNTLNQMFKVLKSTLSMPQNQIEYEIMQNSLEQILTLLESLYIEQTQLKTSKYAKKRIKVDMKVFLKNCESEKLKFSKAFKQIHFNLMIQEDFKSIQETIVKENQTQSSSNSPVSSDAETQQSQVNSANELSKISVKDPYSQIKSSIKNILINRCGVKFDELSQFCNFDAPPPANQVQQPTQEQPAQKAEIQQDKIKEMMQQAIKEEYQTEKLVQDQAIIPSEQPAKEEQTAAAPEKEQKQPIEEVKEIKSIPDTIEEIQLKNEEALQEVTISQEDEAANEKPTPEEIKPQTEEKQDKVIEQIKRIEDTPKEENKEEAKEQMTDEAKEEVEEQIVNVIQDLEEQSNEQQIENNEQKEQEIVELKESTDQPKENVADIQEMKDDIATGDDNLKEAIQQQSDIQIQSQEKITSQDVQLDDSKQEISELQQESIVGAEADGQFQNQIKEDPQELEDKITETQQLKEENAKLEHEQIEQEKLNKLVENEQIGKGQLQDEIETLKQIENTESNETHNENKQIETDESNLQSAPENVQANEQLVKPRSDQIDDEQDELQQNEKEVDLNKELVQEKQETKLEEEAIMTQEDQKEEEVNEQVAEEQTIQNKQDEREEQQPIHESINSKIEAQDEVQENVDQIEDIQNNMDVSKPQEDDIIDTFIDTINEQEQPIGDDERKASQLNQQQDMIIQSNDNEENIQAKEQENQNTQVDHQEEKKEDNEENVNDMVDQVKDQQEQEIEKMEENQSHAQPDQQESHQNHQENNEEAKNDQQSESNLNEEITENKQNQSNLDNQEQIEPKMGEEQEENTDNKGNKEEQLLDTEANTAEEPAQQLTEESKSIKEEQKDEVGEQETVVEEDHPEQPGANQPQQPEKKKKNKKKKKNN